MKQGVLGRSCVFLLTLFAAPACEAAGAEIGGFADMVFSDEQKKNGSFGIRTLEIDITSQPGENVSFEGAVVFDGETASLGQTLADFGIFGEKLGLQAGILDVPFGIDWLSFASCERKLTDAPLTTELMMDGGWSDAGINFHGGFSFLGYNFYAVNGMGVDSSTQAVNQTGDNNAGKTLGGRIEFAPAGEYLKIGFSRARGPYLDDTSNKLWERTGADARASFGSLKLKGEYISGTEDAAAAGKNRHAGYYLQILNEFTEKLYGVVRYGRWKMCGGNEIHKLTLGSGLNITKNVSVQAQYMAESETPCTENNSVSLQTVVSF